MCKKFLKSRKSLAGCQIKKGSNTLHCKIFTIALVLVLVVSSLTYLWLINDRVIMGYEISSLEKKIVVLKDKKQKLDLELIESQEISQIKEKANQMQMAIVEEVEYLNVVNDGLAVR